MWRWAVHIYLLLMLASCQSEKPTSGQIYPDQLGSIAFDAAMDSPDFKLCDETNLVHSRTSLAYKGGKAKIEVLTREWLANGIGVDFEGFVSVHFLVNCQGRSGRVRLNAMDGSFAQKEAPEALVNQLRNMVLSLDEWVIMKPTNTGKDHSSYLIFKIVKGEVVAVTH